MTLFKLENRGSQGNKSGRYNWKTLGTFSKSTSSIVHFGLRKEGLIYETEIEMDQGPYMMMINFTDAVHSDKMEIVFNTYGPSDSHLSYFNNKDTLATMKLYLDLANFVLKNWKLAENDEDTHIEKKEVPFWYIPKMQIKGLNANIQNQKKTSVGDKDDDSEDSVDREEQEEEEKVEKKLSNDATKESSTKVTEKAQNSELNKNKL